MRLRTLLLIAAVVLAGVVVAIRSPKAAGTFVPPDEKERRKAVGDLGGLSPELMRAFDPSWGDPIPAPRGNDWLARHEEAGQTFRQFQKGDANRPDRKRRILYFQPLGTYRDDPASSPAKLAEFAAAYFGLETRALPPLSLEKRNVTSRINAHTGKRQLLTTDLLGLLKKELPPDGYAVLGLTWDDLYPEEGWNFVFGEATLEERVGVHSFARYDPAFHGQPADAGTPKLMLRRGLKVLAHETGHMFGLDHCTHFKCLMNGSNHLAETDAQPLYLCPLDLRKLQASVGFDVVKRYEALRAFYESAGLAEEAEWVRDRVKQIKR